MAGRTVRCANCGHLWYETASADEARAAIKLTADPPADRVSALAGPVIEGPQPAPRLEAPPRPQPPVAPRKGWATAPRLSVIVALLLAVVIVGWIIHREIGGARTSPSQPHASANQSAAQTDDGLVIRQITPSRTADGLVINGEIANLGSATRDVPRLRVALQDAADKEIQSEIVDPPKPRLKPSETAHFETTFAHPPDAATGVVVTFASP